MTKTGKAVIILIFHLLFFCMSFSQQEKWEDLMHKALELAKQNKTDEAITILKEAITTAESAFGKSDTNTALSTLRLGFLYHKKGLLKEAEKLYLAALEIREKAYGAEHPETAAVMQNLGELYQNMGQLPEAEQLFLKALKIREKNFGNEDILVSNTMNSLGGLYANMGRYPEAEKLYSEALDIRRATLEEGHPLIAVSLGNLAALYRLQGYYAEAEPLYKESLKILEDIYGTVHPDIAASLNNLAALYYNLAKYAVAESLYKQSLDIREEIYGKEHTAIATVLNNLAALYRKQGRYSEAENFYKRSLEIYKKAYGENHPDVALSMNNLAGVYLDESRFEEAKPLYLNSLKMRENKFGKIHPEVAFSYNNLAELYQKQEKFTEADSLYKISTEIREKTLGKEHPDYATSLINLAGSYIEQKRYTEAEPILKKSLEIRLKALGEEHPDIATNYINLGRLYFHQKRYKEAEEYFIKTNANLINQISKYFPSMSESEREQFYATLKNKFELFNSFAIFRKDENPAILNEMLNNQLITKALIFNSSNKVKKRILESNDNEIKDKFRYWIKLREFITRLHALPKEEIQKRKINLDSLEKNSNEIEKELSRKSEIFAKEYEKRKTSFKDIQGKLRENEAAINIIRFNHYDDKWTEKIYYAFLIITKDTKDYPKIVVYNNGAELEKRFHEDYIGMLQLNDKGSYRRYFAGIADKLKDEKITRLYISPDGVYNQINISTLRKGDGTFLLDDYDIQLIGNLKDIVDPVFIPDGKTNQNPAELFGYPNYGTYENIKGDKFDPTKINLSELPGTKEEIESISNILNNKKWKVNKYLGDLAREDKIKTLVNPKVLHIATHGFFLEDIEMEKDNKFSSESKKIIENPLFRSGLYLSEMKNTTNKITKDTADNGILTAYEVMSLNLDSTEIVVLSACQTGLGLIKNGEGVYGLQRAFQVAGAKNIIMSLWNVSDEATQKLMTSFYTRWALHKDKRKAFQEAQKELRKEYPSPYYWGAFIMIGE